MNSEENRLATFGAWPAGSAVTAERLARAGFFRTGDGTSVKCFSCDVSISEWEYGDQAMAKHRAASPGCRFVVDASASGNVPASPIFPAGPPSSWYRDEGARLRSFANWPASHIVAPDALAKAGFYYTNVNDSTRCAFCNGTVASWEPHDNPDREHKKYFPNCPFVISTIDARLRSAFPRAVSLTNAELVASANLDEIGVIGRAAPKRPACATFEARARTFAAWPRELCQSADELARAGFCYDGVGDQVRCYHCDGGLRHWDPDDDPWTEHARWFPLCAFVRIVRGHEFVAACAKLGHAGEADAHKEKAPRESASRRAPTDGELDALMSSEAARRALDVGLSAARVRRAIRERLERAGAPHEHADALVLAAINLRLDDGDEPSDRASLEREVRRLREARLCKICMDREVGIVFLPCGHCAACVFCLFNLEDCPVCRSKIKATAKVFLS